MPELTTPINYDALLVVSFGGPEGPDDVIPFLENVLRGRNVPRERMLQVAEHYHRFGGVSPINEQNRKLIAVLQKELDAHGPRLPIYFGNRNWHPLLADTIRQMHGDGVRNALAFVTSAYSSYSSCRQYVENIAEARRVAGPDAPNIEKLRTFYNHPLFIEANVAGVREAFEKFPASDRDDIHVAFTAHSIPDTMARHSDYEVQLKETSRLVADAAEIKNWQLVYQSRSGSPAQPWLGPDICDHLRELHRNGVKNVIVSPVGFVSDHMEIIYDLDLEAQTLSAELGLTMQRAATGGTHPAFVKMIRELIVERTDPNTPKRFLGSRGPSPDCTMECCFPG